MKDSAIAALGTALGPAVLAQCRALFAPAQEAEEAALPPIAADCTYGPHPRHRLDLYAAGPLAGAPIVVFVHGGGFVQGDKAADGWPNAAVGRMAARRGWLGAVINYRLAPDSQWPAGGDDVLAAVDWLIAHGADHGGDPARIVLIGTSAGAVHIATALQRRPDLAVRGCVLLSGLYGYTAPDPRDLHYFGDAADFPARAPRAAVVATTLPLLIACAQYDPPRFQREFLGLLAERSERHGTMPQAWIGSGHNHYSLALHLGTADTRLADEIAGFVSRCCG